MERQQLEGKTDPGKDTGTWKARGRHQRLENKDNPELG